MSFNWVFWFVKISRNFVQVSRSYLFVVGLFDIKFVFTSFSKETLDYRNNLILENTECNGEVYLEPNLIFGTIFIFELTIMTWRFEKMNPWLKSAWIKLNINHYVENYR